MRAMEGKAQCLLKEPRERCCELRSWEQGREKESSIPERERDLHRVGTCRLCEFLCAVFISVESHCKIFTGM